MKLKGFFAAAVAVLALTSACKEDPVDPCADATVNFDLTANDGMVHVHVTTPGITNVSVDFGDGTVVDSTHAMHTYSNADASYTIKVTANVGECSVMATETYSTTFVPFTVGYLSVGNQSKYLVELPSFQITDTMVVDVISENLDIYNRRSEFLGTLGGFIAPDTSSTQIVGDSLYEFDTDETYMDGSIVVVRDLEVGATWSNPQDTTTSLVVATEEPVNLPMGILPSVKIAQFRSDGASQDTVWLFYSHDLGLLRQEATINGNAFTTSLVSTNF